VGGVHLDFGTWESQSGFHRLEQIGPHRSLQLLKKTFGPGTVPAVDLSGFPDGVTQIGKAQEPQAALEIRGIDMEGSPPSLRQETMPLDHPFRDQFVADRDGIRDI